MPCTYWITYGAVRVAEEGVSSIDAFRGNPGFLGHEMRLQNDQS